MKRFRKRSAATLTTGLLVLCGMGLAGQTPAEIAYGVGYAGEYHTNITEAALNEQSGSIHTLVAGGAYTGQTADWTAHALLQGEWSRYADAVFSDTPVYFFDAAALWTIVPRRFTWTFEGLRDQAVIDPMQPVTPDNLSQSTVVETGPDVSFGAGLGNTVELGARFGQLRYGAAQSMFDNDRVSGSARWSRAVNSATTLSLNYEVQGIDFRQAGFHAGVVDSDYRVTHIYLRGTLESLPTRAEIDLGGTHLERGGGNDADTRLARLSLTRNITLRSSVGVSAGIELQDAGSVLLAGVTDPAVSEPGAPSSRPTVTGDVFLNEYQEAFLEYARTVWTAKASAFNRHLDFQLAANNDRTERGGEIEFTYGDDLATTTLFALQSESRHSVPARTHIDRSVGAQWLYRATRSLGLGLRGAIVKRESSDPSDGFNDQYVSLNVYYSSGPSYAPLRR